MKPRNATLAIARTRLLRDLHVVLAWAALGALAAFLQRFDDRFAHLAGALIFTTLAGAGTALALAGRHRELTLCEAAAPLYGRELARARAIAPCLVASAASAAYWGMVMLYDPAPSAAFVALTFLCGYAAALTALCATVVSGVPRAIFIAFAGALCIVSFALCSVPALPILLCAATAFIMLRYYGETIARENPI